MKEKETDVKNLIENEKNRIGHYFEGMPENKKAIISPLIQNAAFMKVTLESLQERINSEGVTEIYQNGANQCGVKQSATLQSYNSLIKNYAGAIKTLSQFLPQEKDRSDSFFEYQREKCAAIRRGERSFPEYEEWKEEKDPDE